MGRFRPGASQKERAEGGREVLKVRNKVPKKGGKDMFEHILEHLVAEGYADTNEAALAIMVNMSEDWRESICEERYKTYVVDIDPKEVEKIYQRKMQAERERKFARRMAKQSVKDSTRED
jgi:hypothetical protein